MAKKLSWSSSRCPEPRTFELHSQALLVVKVVLMCVRDPFLGTSANVVEGDYQQVAVVRKR